MIGGMWMHNGQDHGPQVRALKPQGQFPADKSACLAASQSGYDFHTTPVAHPGPVHEIMQPFKRLLYDITMQIQPGIHFQTPPREALPCRVVQSGCPSAHSKILRPVTRPDNRFP